jgi:hypothetical protein
LINWRLTPTLAGCQLYRVIATDRWFSPGPPVSSTNKTDHHDITKISLKVALNTIPDIPPFFTGTLIVMGVLLFFKKKTGLSPSQAIATKNGNSGWLYGKINF